MEPKTIIVILCVALFIASIVLIAQTIWSKKEVGFLRNVIRKLNEDNSRLDIELDITAKQRDDNRAIINQLNTMVDEYSKLYLEYKGKCKQQSKRIAELIELCNKLQPDLIQRHITINDLIKVKDKLSRYTPNIHVIEGDSASELLNRLNEIRKENNARKSRYEFKGNVLINDLGELFEKGEPFYYYYTYGDCLMQGHHPLFHKMDGGMYRPRKTREEAEADKAFYNSQKQK